MKYKPETLAGLISKSLKLWIYCEECHHNRSVDPCSIDLPPDTPVPAIGRLFWCSNCKHQPAFTRPDFGIKYSGYTTNRIC